MPYSRHADHPACVWQLTGVRHKGSQCITEKLLLVKFHFFGVHFDGPWANGEGAPPLPVLDEVRRH